MHSCGSFQAYAVSDQFLFLLPKLNCSHSSLIILTTSKKMQNIVTCVDTSDKLKTRNGK